LQNAHLFDLGLTWQGFGGFPKKCAEPHRTPLRRGFRAFGAKFSTKLSTGSRGREQLFSGIQNLAAKLKLYFNFGGSPQSEAISIATCGAMTPFALASIRAAE